MTHQLGADTANRFAEIALGHVTREYPHKLDHVMDGPEDVRGPRALHPIFFGSFDWHSCVHGYWLLLRTRRLFPGLKAAARVGRCWTRCWRRPSGGELDYLDRAYTGGLRAALWLGVAADAHREAQRHEAEWAEHLAPLAQRSPTGFKAYLPKLTYPIRTGAHYNSAFALILAREWADANDADLAALIRTRAEYYYGADKACPGWEPAGDDFLSSALTEALLMRLALPLDAFRAWFDAFLPDLAAGTPRSLFVPAFVSDRSDGKIAHLDGVNLSRAWCWRGLADALDPDLAGLARRTADEHLDASLPHVAGDYMGEHWLATFALLALGIILPGTGRGTAAAGGGGGAASVSVPTPPHASHGPPPRAGEANRIVVWFTNRYQGQFRKARFSATGPFLALVWQCSASRQIVRHQDPVGSLRGDLRPRLGAVERGFPLRR
jgi:hypothetical protein